MLLSVRWHYIGIYYKCYNKSEPEVWGTVSTYAMGITNLLPITSKNEMPTLSNEYRELPILPSYVRNYLNSQTQLSIQ